jgi:DNA-directed RNA polymerase II subunit RPB7
MVFFRKQLKKSLQLHPKYLGQNLRQTIKAQLTRDVEGTENGGARIVLVQDMSDDDISKGLVDAQSGFVTFDVKFYAIMFRAFKNEVLLATVTQVSEVCNGSVLEMR